MPEHTVDLEAGTVTITTTIEKARLLQASLKLSDLGSTPIAWRPSIDKVRDILDAAVGEFPQAPKGPLPFSEDD